MLFPGWARRSAMVSVRPSRSAEAAPFPPPAVQRPLSLGGRSRLFQLEFSLEPPDLLVERVDRLLHLLDGLLESLELSIVSARHGRDGAVSKKPE